MHRSVLQLPWPARPLHSLVQLEGGKMLHQKSFHEANAKHKIYLFQLTSCGFFPDRIVSQGLATTTERQITKEQNKLQRHCIHEKIKVGDTICNNSIAFLAVFYILTSFKCQMNNFSSTYVCRQTLLLTSFLINSV